MAIDIAEIKRLRELTGVGMTDAKKALEDNDGYGSRAAVDLEVDYQTLARFIKSDPKLAKAVLELKQRLVDAGFPQRGFGEAARSKLKQYQDNPRPYSG